MNNIVLRTEEQIEPSRAEQLKAVFVPFVAKLEEFESQYNEITIAEVCEATCKKAKRLRLDIAKIRTGTEAARKRQKEECIRVGRAIDGFANIVKFATIEKEEKLEAIEKHFERIEAERVEALREQRANELAEFECYNVPGLGTMDDSVYANFLVGAKSNFAAKVEAERKAEEQRIAAERADAEERERIRVENEKLKKEAAERERQAKIEEKKRAKIEADRLAKEAAERKAREEEQRKEREAHEAELRKEREAARIAAEKAAAERERIEAELKAKVEAERRERDRLAAEARAREIAEEKAKAAPDKKKLESLADELFSFTFPVVSSTQAASIIQDARTRLEMLAEFIRSQSRKI